MSRRTPISISLNVQELARLDDFATHHHINRSEAVRLLLMHARLPGQTRLPIDDIAAALVIDEEHAEPLAPVHAKSRKELPLKPQRQAGPCGHTLNWTWPPVASLSSKERGQRTRSGEATHAKQGREGNNGPF
jgi:hypothetical protein